MNNNILIEKQLINDSVETKEIVIDIIERAFGSNALIENSAFDVIERSAFDVIERSALGIIERS